jgi:hypothetical protein
LETWSGSAIAFRTMKILLITFTLDLVLTSLLLIIHAATGSSLLLASLPYLASGFLLLSVSSLLGAVVYCFLKYPKFRKSIIFIVLLTLVVLIVHLALIQDPGVSFGYYMNGTKTGTVPVSQIPLIPVCQGGARNSCESCSGCVMDELYYVPAATTIIDGIHCAPQVEGCNMEHPPLAKALIAVGIAALGNGGTSLEWGRLLPIILGTACIPLVFAIAWKFSKNKKVAYYSSLFLALDTMFFVHSSISVTDIPMIFFGLAAIVAYLYEVRISFLDKYYVAGALMGLGILSKETAVFLVATLVTFHLLRDKESLRARLYYSLKLIVVSFLVFATGLQLYDSLLTGGQVPTFLNQMEYIISYGSSLVCHPSGFNCPGAFLNVSGNPSTAITPLSWLVYYVPTTYFKSNITVCTGSSCPTYVNLAYYGVTNMIETWSTFVWAPFAAYLFYRIWKKKPERQTTSTVSISKEEEREPLHIPPPTPLSIEDIEKISKLELLLDSGAITREEFDAQKSIIMRAEGTGIPISAEKNEIQPSQNIDEENETVNLVKSVAMGPKFLELDLPIIALIILCWSYFPYLVLFVQGRVTYPFYFLPAVPAISLGLSYLITRSFFPRIIILLLLVAVFAWFLIYFPDQSFLPSWITSHLGT